MRIVSRAAPLPWITWGKAVASQLIVWHHLVHYGPLAPQFEKFAPSVTAWLNTRALFVVQVFLVIAGFLGVRSIWPRPNAPRVTLRQWPTQVWLRFWRLAPPYFTALAAAIICAAIARFLMHDTDTPAAPRGSQVFAHMFLFQDILDVPALSAGVWYVAIDLQLFALLALMAALFSKDTRHIWPLALIFCTALASLWFFNLDSSMDMWAPYFFGAYALGALAAWGAASSTSRGKIATTALIGILLVTALALEWRDRIALAGFTALLLLWQPCRLLLSRSHIDPLMQWLAKTSYSVFLLHYPVSLLVSSTIMHAWPDSPTVHVFGTFLVWALSLACGWLMWRYIEMRPKKAQFTKPISEVPPHHATT